MQKGSMNKDEFLKMGRITSVEVIKGTHMHSQNAPLPTAQKWKLLRVLLRMLPRMLLPLLLLLLLRILPRTISLPIWSETVLMIVACIMYPTPWIPVLC